MKRRGYRLGKRQGRADRTRLEILRSALELVRAAQGSFPSVGEVAAGARVSRLTVYNHFKSKEGLVEALAAEARGAGARQVRPIEPGNPREELERALAAACTLWASDPALFRRLPPIESVSDSEETGHRRLAERLAAADQLRGGCSIKEAEDVIGLLTSFPTFDRLHKDGRRSTAVVSGILLRLAAAILAYD
jgi:AcrR family transcriptional regulator